jgi:hypothetical protein
LRKAEKLSTSPYLNELKISSSTDWEVVDGGKSRMGIDSSSLDDTSAFSKGTYGKVKQFPEVEEIPICANSITS